jgi:hypothetical protein
MAITDKQREAIKKYRASEKGRAITNKYEMERKRLLRSENSEYLTKERKINREYATRLRAFKKEFERLSDISL